jgi:hypothetical protein
VASGTGTWHPDEQRGAPQGIAAGSGAASPRSFETRGRDGERGREADHPGRIPPLGWKDIVWRTWKEVSDQNLFLIAGGVTYAILLALFPGLASVGLPLRACFRRRRSGRRGPVHRVDRLTSAAPRCARLRRPLRSAAGHRRSRQRCPQSKTSRTRHAGCPLCGDNPHSGVQKNRPGYARGGEEKIANAASILDQDAAERNRVDKAKETAPEEVPSRRCERLRVSQST